jgi:flagellar capping protein FliD
VNSLYGLSSANLARVFGRVIEARAARRAVIDVAPASQQKSSESLPVSKPIGESGANVRSINRHNSFVRMFLMETSHLPAQARRAGGGHRVISQDVSFKVMVLPGGSPLAVGGSARTEHRLADGSRGTLEELAYVSFLRQVITGSAALASGAGTQTAPPVMRNTDSLLSAIQVIGDRRLIGRTHTNPLAGLFRSVSPAALEPMVRALDEVGVALGRLQLAFTDLARRETFTAVRAESSSPLFLDATAAFGARPGEYRVEILQRAQGHVIESDAVAPGAMGLSGAFKLNGIEIQVEAGDALFDLTAKINRGEDLDGDGELDAGEDTDGNFRLDGGSSQHAVAASFYGDVLTLRSLNPGAGDIQVEDDDGVLEALGIIKPPDGDAVKFGNEVSVAQMGIIRVDENEFRSDTDKFEDAIRGVTLEVRGVPGEQLTVTVESNPAGVLDAVRTAVSGFNSAIREMNALLDNAGGLLRTDPAATRVRAELVKAVLTPVAGQPADLDEAGDVGLHRAARSRVNLAEEQLAAAARGGTVSTFRQAHGVATVFNSLFELGITAGEDDTLKLDEERFERALAEQPEVVADLFSRTGAPGSPQEDLSLSKGIAVRVLSRLQTALGQNGLLTLRRHAIESIIRMRLGQRFASTLQSSRQAQLLGDILPPAGA